MGSDISTDIVPDVHADSRTRRLVRWLRVKIENKRGQTGDHDPWWVTLMLDVGRPAVAIMILTMCAPGEHYLGVMAGWSPSLAWLTPASLTAYAGISAVVATKRPKGAPGRKTAVWGAVLSILLAMAAQPLAHLYELRLIEGHRFALTIAVSVIPAAVFGHLLHMGAATPKVRRSAPVRADKTVRADRPRRTSAPKWLTDNQAEADRIGTTASALMSAPDSPPDSATWTAPDMSEDNPRTAPDMSEDAPAGRPEVSEDNPGQDTTTVRPMYGSVSAAVRTYLTDNPDATDTELSEEMSKILPKTPWNTIYKARVRHEEKTGKRNAG
jgi:uncharacterized integral membrane protein